ncbi:WYL domain-containing protein [Micrococcus luteus]|nr:WYL domain-containing protein [Micrococcus luteus]
MDSPSARSLRLLALLQTGRRWTVADLSRRLEVAPRTVRRDVARLRMLGYDIQSHPGPGGAYILAPSIKIPPLLLDADEVCALVTGLLILEAGFADDSATTVRAKLERLLPPSLRQRAVAAAAATQVLTATHAFDWPTLGMIADTIAVGQHLGFAYTDQHGHASNRIVQPYRQVLRHGIWYLVAYDTQREDWRLFRSDRVHEPEPRTPAPGYEAHPFPDESIHRWLITDFGRAAQHVN